MNETKMHNLQCLIKKPRDFNDDNKYPVIIFLHGAGTRGKDINKLRKNTFFEIIKTYDDFPFVVVAPLCEENTWFDLFESLKLLVNDITLLPYVDVERIYLMGASMGAYASWQLAMSLPDYFAALVPICGGGMYWNASRLSNIPIWAFHGAKDRTVLLEESQKMVNAVNRSNGNAKLTVYPENEHDAWSDTYSNAEVFDWLLKHKKQRISYNEV